MCLSVCMGATKGLFTLYVEGIHMPRSHVELKEIDGICLLLLEPLHESSREHAFTN